MTRYDEHKYWCKFYYKCTNGDTCTKAYTPQVSGDFYQQGKFARMYSNPPVGCYEPKENNE